MARYFLNTFGLLIITSTVLFAQTSNEKEETGWIEFEFNLPYLFVVVDNNYEDRHLVESGDSIEVNVGYKQLRLVNEVMNDVISYALVEPDTTTYKFYNFNQFSRKAKTSFQVLQNGYNTSFTTEADGKIYVDCEYVGTGTTQLFLSPGKHQLKVIHPEDGEIEFTFKSDIGEVKHINRFHKNPDDFGKLKILPGAAYLSNKQYERAFLTYIAFMGLGVLLKTNHADFLDAETDYNKLNAQYQNTDNTALAIQLRNNMQTPRNRMKELNTGRSMILSGMAALYVITTYHGLQKPKSGYYTKKLNVLPSLDPVSLRPTVSFNIRLGGTN